MGLHFIIVSAVILYVSCRIGQPIICRREQRKLTYSNQCRIVRNNNMIRELKRENRKIRRS